MRILIVDDNADALIVIENFLKALDHVVAACTSGTEALLWLNDFKPEIIIADLEMPEMDGFQFVQQLRYRTSYVNTPVICLTGTATSDQQIEATGFSSVLRKPTTLSDLMTAIEEVTVGLKSRSQLA